jgi:hypothetical protein
VVKFNIALFLKAWLSLVLGLVCILTRFELSECWLFA